MPTLHWLTRTDDLKASERAPYRLLEHDPGLSAGAPEPPNILIQGDNLDALKAILPFFAGKVRCIYIDPPYNTRSAFEHYDDNLEHTQWLAMMWPAAGVTTGVPLRRWFFVGVYRRYRSSLSKGHHR